ncbi:general stress protein [Bacillus canaveralius]|uniref:general stress protein n=1 Tax=Bacillus canaveralius TaxID=1403243 RepID=UPI000F7ACA4D|nr:general stress protein [Bacillus canaveralius]RSK50696.1 hypothetical protein EJA13_14530 [Bacillus canaveralius]
MAEQTKHIVGVYDTHEEAIRAVEDLKMQGYRSEEISVIGKHDDEVDEVTEATGTKAEEGLAAGAATGGALGGLAGLLAGVGALAIPGVGPIIAAGPIAATLTGAAVGAGAGGLTGALIGMGIPEDEAGHYESEVKAGKILVLVDGESAKMSRAGFDETDMRSMDGTVTGTGRMDRDNAYLSNNEHLTSNNPASVRDSFNSKDF